MDIDSQEVIQALEKLKFHIPKDGFDRLFNLGLDAAIHKINFMTEWKELEQQKEEKGGKMNPCAICEIITPIEDLFECEKCGKKVCPDCITNQTMNNEEDRAVCKDCIGACHDEHEEDR